MSEEGYCVKCKAKSKMLDAKQDTMKNGRNMLKGKCAKCSTTMCKILGNTSKKGSAPRKSRKSKKSTKSHKSKKGGKSKKSKKSTKSRKSRKSKKVSV